MDPAAVELSFWETIRSSNNPEDFKAYLEQYPNGRFASLARLRLQPVLTAESKPAYKGNKIVNVHGAPLPGKYDGVFKSDQMGDIPSTVEIENNNGELSGKINTPQGPAAITGGTFDNGKVVMKFDAGGNEGTVTAMLDGDKITGKWELGGQSGGLELKRAGMAALSAAAPAAPKKEIAPASGDPLSGVWDAAADAQGTSIPFTLKLKLEGDKVTGSSDSAQGSVALTKGTWAANKLTFSVDSPNGSIGMTATIKDGKLVANLILQVR